jgi:predicted RNase H-like HicB family nuclease
VGGRESVRKNIQRFYEFPGTYQKGEKMRIKVVLEPSDEGGFTVFVPSLPGCISEGDTKAEALANIQEAIELYLEPVEDDWVYDPTN